MSYLTVSVATLTRRHPWAREVLEWHGVDLDTVDATLSLSALCWLKQIDPDRVARDLMVANPDDTDEALFRFLHGEPVAHEDEVDEDDWDEQPMWQAAG